MSYFFLTKLASIRFHLCFSAVACGLTASLALAGETISNAGITMIDIPAGTFMMGSCELTDSIERVNKKLTFLGQEPLTTDCVSDVSKREIPQHRVAVRAFQIGKTEVTLGQFKKFVLASKRNDLLTDHFIKDNNYGDDAPVMVNKNDAQAFIAWLNKKDGGGWRLPSEAEWEYACRAGGNHKYCGSDDLEVIAWSRSNSDNHPHPVGAKQANAFGLYDMSGNAWEWVEDCWHENYKGAPSSGTPWVRHCMEEHNGDGKIVRGIVRGGSYNFYGPDEFRAARRDPLSPDTWLSFASGFRVVKVR